MCAAIRATVGGEGATKYTKGNFNNTGGGGDFNNLGWGVGDFQ